MKSLAYLSLLLLLTACSVRTIQGRAKPVYFSADDVVFTDSLDPKPILTYHAPGWLYYPCMDVVYLEPGKQIKTLIIGPTIFTMNNTSFLVNPRERIRVTTDSTNYIPSLYTLKKKNVRDRELQVLKRFAELEKKPRVPRLLEYDYQAIQALEASLPAQIQPAEQAAQILFDSLCTVNKVSRKFKRSTRDFVQNKYSTSLLSLYTQYRDTLFARQVYYNKVRAIVPEVNSLDKNSRINDNTAEYINFLNTSLYPSMGIANMVRQYKFGECFDTLSKTYTGPARDLLLSRLMYRAFEVGYGVPDDYEKLYQQYSINKKYSKIVDRARRSFSDQLKRPDLSNDLLQPDGKSTIAWESVLEKHLGKYILVDFWASWCGPCNEDIPKLEALKKLYPPDKLVFLRLSVDANADAWKSRLAKLNSDSTTNYLFVNPKNAAMINRLRLTAIPRYILINPAGETINYDLPRPGEPELKAMLDKLLVL